MISESDRHADTEGQGGRQDLAAGRGRCAGMKQRRNSLILTAVLALTLAVLYIIQRRAVPDSGLKCVIQIDGEQVHTMELDRDGKYRAEASDGHYNIVEVKNGAVMVTEADCPNQTCVRTGGIRNPGEVIACLPHKMIIYIEGETD